MRSARRSTSPPPPRHALLSSHRAYLSGSPGVGEGVRVGHRWRRTAAHLFVYTSGRHFIGHRRQVSTSPRMPGLLFRLGALGHARVHVVPAPSAAQSVAPEDAPLSSTHLSPSDTSAELDGLSMRPAETIETAASSRRVDPTAEPETEPAPAAGDHRGHGPASSVKRAQKM